MMPRLIDGVRLSLGPAWLFLISAEAIAADAGPRLPHLPGAPLSGDGRDPALRRLDHAARLRHATSLLRCVSRRAFRWAYVGRELMSARRRSATSGRRTATRSCSSASTSRSRAARFVSIVGASGCGKTTFLRLLLGQERADARRDPASTASRCRAEPDARPRRRLPALLGVPAPDRARQRRCSASSSSARRCSAALFGARAARGARARPRACSTQVGLGARAATSIRRSSPAACSSASPSPRR